MEGREKRKQNRDTKCRRRGRKDRATGSEGGGQSGNLRKGMPSHIQGPMEAAQRRGLSIPCWDMLHPRQINKLSGACSASQPRWRSTVQMHVPGLGLPLETKTISAVTTREMLTGRWEGCRLAGKSWHVGHVDWQKTRWNAGFNQRQATICRFGRKGLASSRNQPRRNTFEIISGLRSTSVGSPVLQLRRVPPFLNIESCLREWIGTRWTIPKSGLRDYCCARRHLPFSPWSHDLKKMTVAVQSSSVIACWYSLSISVYTYHHFFPLQPYCTSPFTCWAFGRSYMSSMLSLKALCPFYESNACSIYFYPR